MRMKRALLVAALFLVGIGLAILLLERSSPPGQISSEKAPALEPSPVSNGRPSDRSEKVTSENPEEYKARVSAELDAAMAKTPDPAYAKYRFEQRMIDPQFDWKRPINFYGKVVDESNAPIMKAKIKFLWTDLSLGGTSVQETESDQAGLFALEGERGKHLQVFVSKDGYYTSLQQNQVSFEYASPHEKSFHVPNASVPVLFRLQRKGPGEVLMRRECKVPVPKDGSSIRVDFATGKVSAWGQLEIRSRKGEKDRTSGRNDWDVRISIVQGGLVESAEEFPFLAPEGGYANAFEVSYSASNAETWKPTVEKQFYFWLEDAKQFGRMKVFTSALNSMYYIDSWINPTGSRSLEPAEPLPR